MDLLKSSTTNQQQPLQSGAGGSASERAPAADTKGAAAAPARQRDAVSANPTAVPASAPVGDDAVAQRRGAELNAQRMGELAKMLNRELEFRMADSGRAIIDVVDKETGEVIRTIPPDDQQRILDALAEGDLSLLPVDGPA